MKKTFTLVLASAVIVVSAGAIAWSLAGILDFPEIYGKDSIEDGSSNDNSSQAAARFVQLADNPNYSSYGNRDYSSYVRMVVPYGADAFENYYIGLSINKIRYDFKTVIQEILDDGFTTTADLDQELEPGQFLPYLIYFNIGDETYFAVQITNQTRNTLPLSQCTIREFHVDYVWYKKISMVGGLGFGLPREHIVAVFGKDPLVDDGSCLTYVSKGEKPGTFTFYLDKAGNIRSAQIMAYS